RGQRGPAKHEATVRSAGRSSPAWRDRRFSGWHFRLARSWSLHPGSRGSEHVADPTADPEPPVNRSVEVEALAVQWMALLKAGDAAAAISLISPDEATLLVGNGPADWYPGGRATIEHVREAITAYGGPPVRARRTRGMGRRRRRLVRR